MKSLYRKSIDLFSCYPDLIFIFGFLLTFSFTFRKVIFSFNINGNFNEFTSGYIYLADIFLILAFITFTGFTLVKRKIKLITNSDSISLFKLVFLLTLLSFISILWSQCTPLAIYRSARIFLFGLFILYSVIRYVNIKKLDRVLILNISYTILFFVSLFNSIVAIFQFIFQKSIGLYILGESYLAPNLAGVAKLTALGHKFIRSYGIFPHPNILGGFLLFSIIISYFFIQSSISARVMHIKWSGWLFRVYFLLQLIALFFTFSKTAYIGLIIFGLYFLLQRVRIIRNMYFRAFHRIFFKHYALIIFSLILIAFIYTSFYSVNIAGVINKSLNERQLYIRVAYQVIKQHPLLGIGSGQFVSDMANYSQIPIRSWEFQPVHNVFLLIWSELGIFGLLSFFAIFYILLFKCSTWNFPKTKNKNVPRGTLNTSILLISFIPVMFFDHYLWDLYPGMQLLMLIILVLHIFREKSDSK